MMQGNDHRAAAEPNWLDQAEEQASALFNTIEEIGDPTLLEAWDALDDRIAGLRFQKNREQEQ